ncbi:MAG: copper resistance system multicopper oxidase [Phenylobacterium sp.]|uniref:copper resistance system multicopper oxidase n=1 Tax=Phenylobacterium sp. TaxID=1871053 RepID=UPI0027280190|nr:copper resistance system multicopper oxidase [Phenylobacterium sp.]MDO8912608.1 copper resistance system multicopper oxidase [Phenylobacterium sp.]MDP3101665.1 copper resistance system multicopper oxidase [Phenylobacterium sp.]
MPRPLPHFDRRSLLRGAAILGAGAAVSALLPSWALSASPGVVSTLPTVSGDDIKLTIGHTPVTIDGKSQHAVTINGTVPGPLLRLREGQRARISVTNTLDEESSIHWHGLLVPFQMDGVPGVSFPGIPPGETFVYEFPVIQSGTYWYHSHSSLQEAEGHYAPIVIEPAKPDPVVSEREHVIVLADHSEMHPHLVFKRLKQQAGVFNFQRQTIAGLLAGKDQTLAERIEWAKMLMDPTDISDVTGSAQTFLVNGHGPKDNWTGLFSPGERVRLRFVNAAAQMIFNVRIPGLKLTVVAADGQNVRPIEVDEFQIGNAETYDIIVQPTEDGAYTLVAEAIDRSGMARATLAPRAGMRAAVPPLRERPILTMKDMGMDMSAHGGHDAMAGMDHASMPGMDHQAMAASPPPGMAPPRKRGSDVMGDMSGMDMNMLDWSKAPGVKKGPGVQMIAPMPMDRTGEPGLGLESVGHRVLVYKDLVALEPNPDSRPPDRALDIHLTGNMERFWWGFDGWKFSENPPPYAFRTGERVRVTLINDSMMTHPIHLHGHFFELVHGPVGHMPRKHTVNVAPGGKVTFDMTAEAGDWAFHCHMLYHMHAGMFQVFKVRPAQGVAA